MRSSIVTSAAFLLQTLVSGLDLVGNYKLYHSISDNMIYDYSGSLMCSAIRITSATLTGWTRVRVVFLHTRRFPKVTNTSWTWIFEVQIYILTTVLLSSRPQEVTAEVLIPNQLSLTRTMASRFVRTADASKALTPRVTNHMSMWPVTGLSAIMVTLWFMLEIL